MTEKKGPLDRPSVRKRYEERLRKSQDLDEEEVRAPFLRSRTFWIPVAVLAAIGFTYLCGLVLG